MADNNETDIMECFNLGRAAYHKGIAAPAYDAAMRDWLNARKIKVGEGVNPLKAWLNGWYHEHDEYMQKNFPLV